MSLEQLHKILLKAEKKKSFIEGFLTGFSSASALMFIIYLCFQYKLF